MHTVTDTRFPLRASQTFLNIAMDLCLEQLVCFPTWLQYTLNLIFTSYPSYKNRCKPLPSTGLKSDHDIVLLDTAHRPHRYPPPHRKIYMWKKANVQGIREYLQDFSRTFCSAANQSFEQSGHHSKLPLLQQSTSLYPPRCQTSDRHIHGLIQDWDACWDVQRAHQEVKERKTLAEVQAATKVCTTV